MAKINNFYDKKIVYKPWGYEYTIYRYRKNLIVTFLNIKKNKETSLHCHPNKRTGFILLKGKARIQLGLWKSNSKIYHSPSKLMIREGLFHSIKCLAKEDLCALEFENPVNKRDLVRFKDNYGRQSKPYEGKKFTKEITNENILFKKPKLNKPQIYKIGKTQLSLELHKNFKKLNKEKMDTIFAILHGKVINKSGKNVLSYGDIIKTGTLKKLSEVFSVKGKLAVLKVKKIVR